MGVSPPPMIYTGCEAGAVHIGAKNESKMEDGKKTNQERNSRTRCTAKNDLSIGIMAKNRYAEEIIIIYNPHVSCLCNITMSQSCQENGLYTSAVG